MYRKELLVLFEAFLVQESRLLSYELKMPKKEQLVGDPKLWGFLVENLLVANRNRFNLLWNTVLEESGWREPTLVPPTPGNYY